MTDDKLAPSGITREEQLRALALAVVECWDDSGSQCVFTDVRMARVQALASLLAAVPSSADGKGGDVHVCRQQTSDSPGSGVQVDAGVKHPADNTSEPSADVIARIVAEMRERIPKTEFDYTYRSDVYRWANELVALASSGAPQRTALRDDRNKRLEAFRQSYFNTPPNDISQLAADAMIVVIDLEAELRERLAPHGTAEGWRPIETAPKNGTRVFLYWRAEHGADIVDYYAFAYWIEYGDGSRGWHGESFYASKPGYWTRLICEQPTHWMPLPAAPQVPGPEKP